MWSTTDFRHSLHNGAYTAVLVARYSGSADDARRVLASRGSEWYLGFDSLSTSTFKAGNGFFRAGEDSFNRKWQVHVVSVSDTEVSYYQNATRKVYKHQTASTLKPRQLQLGAHTSLRNGRPIVGEMSVCQVAEVVLFDRALQEEQILALTAYLTEKYVGRDAGRVTLCSVRACIRLLSARSSF